MPQTHHSTDIVYQIFPDRWMRTGEPAVQPGAWKWGGHPIRFSNRHDWLTDHPSNQHTFLGGTLEGVRRSLDHLADLGVTALYLTPIFAACSTHRYDATDYERIDPILGTRADFEALVADLRQRKIGLVLDGVFNHTSDQHPWHRDLATRRSTYVMKDAEHPMTWMDGGTLPKLDTQSPEVVRRLLQVLDAWPEANQWRLDAAHLLPRELLRTIREHVAPRPVLVEDWMHCGHYFRDGLADGTTNFLFRESLRNYFKEDCSPQTLLRRLEVFLEGYPARAVALSWNLLENHDTPRFGSLVGRLRLWRALVLMFTLPGAPLLYHGTEVGMEGKTEGQARAPMIWDRKRWDLDLLGHVRALASLRHAWPLLARGRFEPLLADNRSRTLAYARTGARARLVVALNDGYQPFTGELDGLRLELDRGAWLIAAQERGAGVRLLLAAANGSARLTDGR